MLVLTERRLLTGCYEYIRVFDGLVYLQIPKVCKTCAPFRAGKYCTGVQYTKFENKSRILSSMHAVENNRLHKIVYFLFNHKV